MTPHDRTECWTKAACQGDRLAMAKLLALDHPRFVAYVAARLDPATARRASPEDILQEVYLRVLSETGRFVDQGAGSLTSWITTIIDHKLADAKRAARRQRRDVAREAAPRPGHTESYWKLLDQVYADTTTPSRVVRHQEAVGALLASLAELSESQRHVIELRFLQGLPIAEVAQRLARSEDAVVALTQRALAALRAVLARHGDITHGQ